MKKLTVEVVPGAKTNEVLERGKGKLKVRVEVPASAGKANKSAIELLAFYLGIKKNQLVILSGEKSRIKKIGVLKKDKVLN